MNRFNSIIFIDLVSLRLSRLWLPKAFCTLLLNACNITNSNSQQFLSVGARANGMGETTITLPDAFSVFSNPANAVYDPNHSIGIGFDHRYHLIGLSNMAIAGNFRKLNSSFSGGISRYGDALYNHSRVELAGAHKLENFSLGLGAGYQQMAFQDNGSAGNVTFQMGGIAQLSPKFTYGAHAYNFLRAKVFKTGVTYYPVVMRMGISYKIVNQATLNFEIEKDSRFNPNFKAGLEYHISGVVFVRTGINTNPAKGYFGSGIKVKEGYFDYALTFTQRAGFSHFISFSYSIKNSDHTTQNNNPEHK